MQFTASHLYDDYKYRQTVANEQKAILYVEQHFNSYTKNSNYALCKVNEKAHPKALEFATVYNKKVSELLGIPLYKGKDGDGLIIIKRGQRDFHNLEFCEMPAIILQPIFVSNTDHVDQFFQNGRELLAKALAESIREVFPEGGFVAMSVAHKYKRSKPCNRGASVWGKPEFTESDLAEQVLWIAKFLLEYGTQPAELKESGNV